MLARVLLAFVLIAGLVIRIIIVFSDEGIYWPDEIYQSFEPAHKLVFGYGLVPWEFIEGARNWALPGVVALVLKLCALFGGDSPFVYIRVTKLVFALASIGTAIGVFRLAKAYGAKDGLAAIGASLFALCGLCLYFSHRAMSENATALPVVWGLAFVLDKNASARRLVIGASLLGIGVLLRIQSAVFCVGALSILLCRMEWKRTIRVFIVLLAWAFAYGALDAVTWRGAPGAIWGGWFHSAIVYIRFNLIEGRAADWGTAPWTYYFRYMWSSMPSVTIMLALGAVCAWRRATGLLALVLSFLVIHSLIPHKELRFIIPVLPLLCALTAVGFSDLPGAIVRRIAASAALAAVLVSVVAIRSLTFGDIGAYPDRGYDSAWDDMGYVNRLMLEASRRKDLCGICIDANLAWTGGSTYLHLRAPLYASESHPPEDRFNYAIVAQGTWDQVIAYDRKFGYMLVKLGNDLCAPDPGYPWLLP
jgi:hypothetical protein